MKKSIFYYLSLILISVNIALAQESNRNYHLFIYQSDCSTHATLYYKLTAEENMDDKDYIITVATASADLVSNKQCEDNLNTYIDMSELCLKKLQNIYNPDAGDNKVINLASIMITNESYLEKNTETSSKLTNFNSVLNQALPKYNFLCDVDNITFIDYFNFLDKVAQVMTATNNINKLKQDNNSLTAADYNLFISSFLQATNAPNEI